MVKSRRNSILLWGFGTLIILSLLGAIGLPAQLQCRLSIVCEHGVGYYIGQIMYFIVLPVEIFLSGIGSDVLRIPLYLIWFFVIGLIIGMIVERFKD